MDKTLLASYKDTLVVFREDFGKFCFIIGTSTNRSELALRTKLQEQMGMVAKIVDEIHDDSQLSWKGNSFSFYDILSCVLDESSVGTDAYHRAKTHVRLIINDCIGRIDSGIIREREIHPILSIRDQQLSQRCLDLLNDPGSFDRVINQATQVLEDRLRSKLPFEKLCTIIPEAKNQIGENLVNKLLAPPNPHIIISDKPEECKAFHKMIVGTIAYLRNSSHHFIKEDTEWSLAWSVVGIIDSLLATIDNAYVMEQE